MCKPQFCVHHMDIHGWQAGKRRYELYEWDVRETLDTGFTDTNEPVSQDKSVAQKR